jgi:hypothetical protein
MRLDPVLWEDKIETQAPAFNFRPRIGESKIREE